ncbi:MAG: hypothetical protein AB1650_08010 [Candidatus Omnitrophota bacterium]
MDEQRLKQLALVRGICVGWLVLITGCAILGLATANLFWRDAAIFLAVVGLTGLTFSLQKIIQK